MGLKISYVEFFDAKFCYMETMGYFVRVNLNLIAIEANYLAIGPIFYFAVELIQIKCYTRHMLSPDHMKFDMHWKQNLLASK